MQKSTLQELINFCESKKLTEIASGLKSELKSLKKQPQQPQNSTKTNKNGQSSYRNSKDNNNQQISSTSSTGREGADPERRTLKVIRDAIRRDERRKNRDEVKKQVQKSGSSQCEPPARRPADYDTATNMNKEENEEIMEGLMNKIVAAPAFVNDDDLNSKIEQIFGVEAFQKMVDNADVFQDISNTSLFNQSEFLQRSMNAANQSFTKLLPTHSQIREDQDPEELPRFGATEENIHDAEDLIEPEKDEIDFNVERLLGGTAPIDLVRKSSKLEQEEVADTNAGGEALAQSPQKDQQDVDQQSLPVNDDSFSNLQMAAAETPKIPGEVLPAVDEKGEGQASLKMSMIHPAEDGAADSFFQNQSSFVFGNDSQELHQMNREGLEEYVDDDDAGFDTYVVNEENFVASCRELANQNNFPARAIKPDTAEEMQFREKKREQRLKETKNLKKEDSALMLKNLQNKRKSSQQSKKGEGKEGGAEGAATSQEESPKKNAQDDDELVKAISPVKSAKKDQEKNDTAKKSEKSAKEKEDLDDDDGRKVSVLPRWIKFSASNDPFYPAEFDNVIYDCYNLRVVFDREKTGFEETKDFPIVINSIVAGRYQVVEYLGSAAFSKAIQCYDIHSEQMVCMKIIENNKDYFDQSIDEIKLLRYIQANCEDLDNKNLLKVIDFFYHKEHLFIVTELLRDNLYEYSKYNREVEKKMYFNVPRLQKITKQILNALSFIHELKLVHCDLKPENILIKSYSRCEVKVIDFGSSCFIHDHLSSYVQSRSYRAPEVILGCRYDYKIDMWSLGCILAELFTGYVLFQNDSVQGLLSRVIGIIGPIPEYMMKEGRLVSNFFTREGLIYQEASAAEDEGEKSTDKVGGGAAKKGANLNNEEDLKINILVSKRTTLKNRMHCDDRHFVDFVRWLLEVDPLKRPTAKEALQHPWLTEQEYNITD